MKRKPNFLRHWRKQMAILVFERWDILIGILLVAAAGLTLELFAVGVDHAVEKLLEGQTVEASQSWFIVICLILTLFLGGLIWSCQIFFRRLHVRYQIRSEEMPKPYLVIFVSKQELMSFADVPEIGPVTFSGATLNRNDLLGDAELIHDTQSRPWSWEMVLRGIAPHLSQLRRIYLVGSKESQGKSGVEPGTFAQCELLRRFLVPYLMANGKAATPSGAASMIIPWQMPVDFENFKDVYENLKSIHDLLDEELTEETELCVDITGGQKPTSAAAGLFTVNKDVVIQYVQTNHPKKPQIYDVRLMEWPKKPE